MSQPFFSRPFFTWEDAKAAFSIFCFIYGIGTLGMPANFSRAGPYIATVALIFMAAANIYGSVIVSRILLIAPKSVRTYSDLGQWCLGRTGHILVVLSQMGVCLFVPIAFLILGSSLLDTLVPDAFSQSVWVVLMALTTVPFCLTPTLKEGAMAAFAGCVGTLAADFIGVGVLLYGMRGHPSVPAPQMDFDQIVTVFGNLAMAYGAANVIPAVQRQHSDPTRMPRVVFITLTLVTILFFAISGSAYSSVGCQIPGNILFAIANSASTGLTKLGFASDRGMVVLAYFAMQVHMIIGFAVILAPAFYLFERLVLGMHERPKVDVESTEFVPVATPEDGETKDLQAKTSVVASIADLEEIENGERERLEYKGKTLRYITLRLVIIAIMIAIAIAFQDKFSDVVDFVGASCLSTSCIIMPIIFGIRKLGHEMPWWEKTLGLAAVIIAILAGLYVTYTSGVNLFAPVDSSVAWPFCKGEYRNELYYNYTAVHETARFL